MKITKTKKGFIVKIKGFKTEVYKTDKDLLNYLSEHTPGYEIRVLSIVEKFGKFEG